MAEESRLDQIEKRVQHLEQRNNPATRMEGYALPGLTLLGLALFCALWARSTGRDPWLWLVAGLVFNVFALFAIWVKHEDDKDKAKVVEQSAPMARPREEGTSSQNIKPA